MNELLKLKEKRGTILAAVKEIMNRAKARPEADQDLTPDESAQVDKLWAEYDAAGRRIETLERMTQLERAEAELREVTRRTAGPIATPHEAPNYEEAVRAWMLRGNGVTADQVLTANRAGVDVNANSITIRMGRDCGVVGVYNGDPAVIGEQRIRRDLATTTGTSAMVQWKEFTSEFDKALQFRGYVLNLVKRIRTATGVGLPVPKIDDTANRGRWLAEGSSTTNTDPTLAQSTLGAFKASSDKVPISIEALQDDQVTMNMIIPEILGERIGGLYNLAATRGTGSGEPAGILQDSTASGVVIAGTNASPTYSWDNLLDLKASVDPAYRNAPAAKRGFMLSDTVFQKYRKLKDGNSRYFADPFVAGPGTFDGDPIFLNNDVLATGVSAKVGCYGDFSRYWWRDVMEVTFYRLDQVAILDGKIVFLAFARADGKLINTAAVKHMLNPAS